MGFLTPLFLLGIGAVAAPLLIHLSRRRTQKTVPFPSLMFLEQVPYRSMKRRRLRDVLLLIARCAALILLALAFARPLIEVPAGAIGGVAREELVVLLDRSFSMGYGDRWQRAIEAADQQLTSGTGEDSISLVLFDQQAEAISEPTADAALLQRLLSEEQPSDRVTRYAPALRVARRILLDSELSSQRVVLISDLQKTGWKADDDARLPAGVELQIVDLGDGSFSNVAVSEVELERDRDRERERIRPSVRLIHRGARGAVGGDGSDSENASSDEDVTQSVEVELEINGRVAESRSVELGDNQSETVRFEPLTLESGITSRGTVRLSGDGLGIDNEYRFTLSPANAISVLLVERPRRRRDSIYVARALGTAKRPPFELIQRTPADLRPDDLSKAAVVIVNDSVQLLSEELRGRLMTFVESGGGVLLSLGASYGANGALPALGLRGDEGVSQDRNGRSLAMLDYGHEIFEPFAAARAGDFSAARFFRYRDLGEDPEATVLARFDNGAAALVQRALGEGRALIWTSTLDPLWGNLVLQPVFVPWIDRSVRFLAGYSPPREAYRVGQVAELELEEGGEWVVETPAGEKMTVSDEDVLLLPFDQSGFWQVRSVDTEQDPVTLAVNVDVTESDLSRLDPDEAVLLWSSLAGAALDSAVDGAGPAKDPGNQKLWWGVLLAAALVLVTESLSSNRRGRARLAT